MHKVIHFEIPALETARATEFYRAVFGWQSNEMFEGSQYFICHSDDPSEPGIDGAIMQQRAPGQPVVCTIQVPSVDAACEGIVKSGGEVVVPKMEIPGVGFKAYFKDTEGNIFGVAELTGA